MTSSSKFAEATYVDLVDESGSTLSVQRERYMREEIVQFEHDNKVS